ncbi:MAG: hypothetical protein K8I82_25175, partial [Anaerolineae bacterium]|nr:hypothetical protein [Anaerolineae bacterium]
TTPSSTSSDIIPWAAFHIQGYWDFYGVLSLTVDEQGQIQFGVNPGIEIPTFLGTFGVGAAISSPMPSHTLTLIVNGKQHVYDMHGSDFSFTLKNVDSLTVTKEGNHLTIEILQHGWTSGPPVTFCQHALQTRFHPGQAGTTIQKVKIRPEPTAVKGTTLVESVDFVTTGAPFCAYLEGKSSKAELLWWPVEIRSGQMTGEQGWIAESGRMENLYNIRPR